MTAPPAGWAAGARRPRPVPGDLNRDPFIIFWELTRACALACRHCRAEAQPQRHPLELTTDECQALLDELTHFGHSPIVILSGGDPFMRRDLFDIVSYARKLNLTVAVAPSATALVTEERLARLVELGVSSISLSLDGAGPAIHDAFRGFPGTYDRTIRIALMARRLGLPFQINTAVSHQTWRDLSLMATVVEEIGASTWDLFFLVPTGRAKVEDMLTPEEHEHVFEWVLDHSKTWPFRVKTTLGQHYRRAFILRRLQAGTRQPVGDEIKPAVKEWWPGPATNDGRGVFFVSHVGDVYPSGFLPIRTGNVRKQSVVELYRHDPMFRQLRNPAALKGKCGICPFNEVCGGSRARAYALTGDPFAEEPVCAYQPAATQGSPEDSLIA
ncbi:MAG: TIGR04053 family radical SAM/SPASM domain-containing protein [Chloroflexi bacterium]|nr:TIGR04053 family radical SAM/SPASM domain-containing protein [Chloroflexota bacterium]